MSVRTRFAPSPTGFLHIGGVRTALFNWLYARKLGGTYVLRVDDTDQQRNVDAALAPILHGFEWLSLKWDEGPLFQSKRTAQYQKAVDELVARGAAYYDSTPAEEIEAERKICEKEKRPFVHARKRMSSAKTPNAVVRLMMPREGSLKLEDLVRGEVEFQWAQEADHVIQRADGTFIYHLANVVDDRDYEITHVIRAEEHLSNTPRQVFMVQALGYPMPAYAHLPYVAEPGSKRKLSKRKLDQYLKNPDFKKVHDHGTQVAQAMKLSVAAETFNPVIVDFYEQVGYLPDAIVNYLLLLGWSLDDKTEWFSRDEMVRDFSLERVQKAPASFDPAKLQAFQTHYMQQVPLDDKVRRVRPFVERAGITVDDAMLRRIVEALGDRIKVFGDILVQGAYLFGDEVPSWDDKAFAKRVLAPGAVDKLRAYREWLATPAAAGAFERGDAPSLEQATQAWLDERGWALVDIVHAVRVAVTGVGGGPGLFDCLALLGRDRCLGRIDRALQKAAQPAS
ncbi:MAG TPA: glutamate--tRNA ligase family protein [Polyangia bacterium]